MKTVFIDDYPVYEDTKWLTNEEDIENAADSVYEDYMHADSEGYCSEATVLFKVGESYYLVNMVAEVAQESTDYGDVFFIGELTDITSEKVSVKESPAYEIKAHVNLTVKKADFEKLQDLVHGLGGQLNVTDIMESRGN